MNRDPSAHSGNRRVRRSLEATALALSLTALAASGCSTDGVSVPKPSTTSSSLAAEKAPQTLPEQLQAELNKLATAVIKTSNNSDARFRTITTPQNPGNLPQNPGMPQALTTVEVTTNALVGADHGVYNLTIGGDLDAEGKKVDPAKANQINIDMGSYNEGQKPDGKPASNLYSFELLKADDSVNWRVVRWATAKDGTPERHFYITEPVPTDNPGQLEPLTPEVFNQLSAQAEVVVNWAAGAEPVNYVPAN